MAFNWLTAEARATIIEAFGFEDGTRVINATNEYLNNMAVDYPDKAATLVGFINEDPMMVCSLGLEPQGVTMPTRFGIVSVSGVKIVTPFYATPQAEFNAIVYYSGGMISLGTRSKDEGMAGAHSFYIAYQPNWGSGRLRVCNGGLYEYSSIIQTGVHTLRLMPRYGYIDDMRLNTGKNTGASELISIYRTDATGTEVGNGFASVHFTNMSDNIEHTFIPFISQTRHGMIDLATLEFYHILSGSLSSMLIY